MLKAVLVIMGVIGVGALLWRKLRGTLAVAEPFTRSDTRQRARADRWISRLESIQVVSVIIGVASIPMTFVVMVGTGSAVLTVVVMCGVVAGGVGFGICEVVKGMIEAGEILSGRAERRDG